MSKDAGSKVVIGSGRHKLPFGARTRAAILIAGAVLFLAVIIGGGYLLFRGDSKKTTTTTTAKQNPIAALKTQQTAGYKKYAALLAAHKYDEARTYVAQMPISSQEKASLLKDIDSLTSDNSSVLAGYLAKDTAGTLTYSEADLVGDMYAAQGDKTNAKVYYQKAVTLVNKSSSPTKEDDAGIYQRKINAL